MSLLTHPAQAGQLNRFCAWTLLVLSLLTLLWSVCQLVGVLALDAWDVRTWLASHNLVPGGLLGWIAAHATTLSALQLLSCVPCVAIAMGMLGKRQWARAGFIVLLLLTAALNLAVVPLMDRLLMDMLDMLLAQSSEFSNQDDLAQIRGELRDTRIMLWVSSALPILALSAIHVWLALRYHKADMRQLFD
jgi:hypothetical protein